VDGEQIEKLQDAEQTAGSPAPDQLREEANRARGEVDRLGAELESTRRALATADRELAEMRSQRSTERARLQRQVYWVERWRVDLDSLMERRPLMLAFRALQRARRLKRGLSARRR
jgi:predicted  nucleic acid-binding Zn-ribbon protein